MQIEIWSLGKANDALFAQAIEHYLKRVQPWCKTELVILPTPQKAGGAVEAVLAAEEALILRRLKPQHYLIVLDERGRQLDSPQWAAAFEKLMNGGLRSVVLLIGGAFGVSDAVRAKAPQVWSLSKLVFPHQLVRLMVAEQLYRAFSILHGSSYHHS